jgi:hypothetical protein
MLPLNYRLPEWLFSFFFFSFLVEETPILNAQHTIENAMATPFPLRQEFGNKEQSKTAVAYILLLLFLALWWKSNHDQHHATNNGPRRRRERPNSPKQPQNLGDGTRNRQWISPLLYCTATLGR